PVVVDARRGSVRWPPKGPRAALELPRTGWKPRPIGSPREMTNLAGGLSARSPSRCDAPRRVQAHSPKLPLRPAAGRASGVHIEVAEIRFAGRAEDHRSVVDVVRVAPELALERTRLRLL